MSLREFAGSRIKCAVTPATLRVTLPGMILTELGVDFRKDGDRWRCVEHPNQVMLRDKGIQSRHYQTNTLLTLHADGQVAGTTC